MREDDDYLDRAERLLHALTVSGGQPQAIRLKREAATFIRELMGRLVRVGGERDDLLNMAEWVIVDDDSIAPADVNTDAAAVAFITEVTNKWH